MTGENEEARGRKAVIRFDAAKCVHSSKNKPYCDGSHKIAGFRDTS